MDYFFKGKNKTAGIAPVILKGWSIAITQDESEFLAAAHSIRNSILTVTAITVLLVCGMVYLFARSITIPLNKAVVGLQDIAQGEGNLTMRLQVTSKDEIGELAQWFNTFIEKAAGNYQSNCREHQPHRVLFPGTVVRCRQPFGKFGGYIQTGRLCRRGHQ